MSNLLVKLQRALCYHSALSHPLRDVGRMMNQQSNKSHQMQRHPRAEVDDVDVSSDAISTDTTLTRS